MGVHRVKQFIKIIVRFEERPDGGLRAWSDDVPGFVLSHPDAKAVLEDVEPALETILSSMYGAPVMVAPLVEPKAVDQQHCLPARKAAKAAKAAKARPVVRREYASQLIAA
ncbi:MAG: hypothetical protein V4499_05230 [Pseudomonadota bacterium]